MGQISHPEMDAHIERYGAQPTFIFLLVLWVGGLTRIGYQPAELEVVGSNPTRPACGSGVLSGKVVKIVGGVN